MVAMELTDYDTTVLLSGYYSSHGDSNFDSVDFGVGYEFKENRYRPATKAELRNMCISEILE
jgi:hypothetical protein